ncbi:MAG: hypothetical protein K1X67_09375 [Fimbriimonadaceae bacterium]|nr:hypothetical protein [Fimbriimonadaceae bacterium]
MTNLIVSLIAATVMVPPGQSDTDRAKLFTGLGNLHRKVTTDALAAQIYFDQGLAFLYAFNHDEAIRSFTQATKFDPECAMAWWGIAIANGPHINNPMVDEEHSTSAWNALLKAQEFASLATPVERALIGAAGKRYASPAPPDRKALDQAYADAMRRVWKKYPKDPDIGALFAESMMDLRPWDLWKPNGSPQPGTLEIVRALEDVLRVDSKHPLGLHLYIHAVEASPDPWRAMDEADRLRFLQPSLGHMVHMPSHIDVRTGQWLKAMESNERAIKADDTYRERVPNQGFYQIYMTHNHHMFAFAAMMRGEGAKAIQAMDDMMKPFPPEWLAQMAPFVDGYMAMPIEVRVRFGKWDEVLAQPDLPEHFPIAGTLRAGARAVAFAAKGDPVSARREQTEFYRLRRQVPKGSTVGNSSAEGVMTTAMHLMNGEILLAEGSMDAALARLRQGVASEDRLRYNEPPDWIQPVRHTLGAALLKAGRLKEAEQVYRADLAKLPNNGWSLYGLSEVLARRGQNVAAKKLRQQFEIVWARADTPITSSCLCLPNH